MAAGGGDLHVGDAAVLGQHEDDADLAFEIAGDRFRRIEGVFGELSLRRLHLLLLGFGSAAGRGTGLAEAAVRGFGRSASRGCSARIEVYS